MKKALALITTLLFTIALASCGNTSTTSSGDASLSPQEASTSEIADVPAETVNAESDPTSPDTESPTGESNLPEKSSTNSSYSMGETVLVDDDHCAFTITGIKDSRSSVELNVQCENRTDLVLIFSWNNTTVNGCVCDPFWATEVAAGKTAYSSISFSKSDLETFSLLPVDELQFDLHIYDSDDWLSESFVNERFAIYPTSLSADSIAYPPRLVSETEQVVVDNDDFTFIIYSSTPDGFYGYSILAYIENKTDSTLMFSWDDVSVNGIMCDPFWASEVPSHAYSYEEISFCDSDFEEKQ
ncbi:MAG: hypothetical protein IJ751_06125, partial [Oscillospiraceae bacterium]|nr:hypothetical protein [Oscillospiraceae bacterium]